jgi:hypothetical protein
MSLDAPQDPIPTAVKDLLALFDGPLAEVHFPDVDAAALRALAASVKAATDDVEAAAQMWAAAKRAVDERLEMLVQKTGRALAYARVYAEDKPELAATLAAVAMPRSADARGPKSAGPDMTAARKRGRPKKTAAAEPPPPPSGPTVTLLPASTAEEATAEEATAAAE